MSISDLLRLFKKENEALAERFVDSLYKPETLKLKVKLSDSDAFNHIAETLTEREDKILYVRNRSNIGMY